MSVELSPSGQLGFPRPLTQVVKRSLLIHNPHPSPIAFKVKTTAPKQYCVRPNSGRVEGGESVEVQVLLQALEVEPPAHAKCKDKFLVQSAFIAPDEEMKSLADMWSHTEKTNKSAIHEQKVKCAYIASEEGPSNPNGIPEENEDATSPADQSRMLEESANFHAPHDGLSKWTTRADREINPILFRNGGYTYYEVLQEPYVPGAKGVTHSRQIFAAAPSSPTNHTSHGDIKSIPGSNSAPVEAPTATTLPSLTAQDIDSTPSGVSPTNGALEKSLSNGTNVAQDKYNAALQEIEKLKAQVADGLGPTVTGLRKRGGAVASDVKAGAETAVEKTKEVAQSSGVPIEVVGALVLAVFVLTYLFF